MSTLVHCKAATHVYVHMYLGTRTLVGYVQFISVLRLQGSAADSAGIHQGDELLAVDGASLSSATPYQVLPAVMSPLLICVQVLPQLSPYAQQGGDPADVAAVICVQVLPSSVPMHSNVATLKFRVSPAGVRDAGRQPWSGRHPATAAAHARGEGRRREGAGPQCCTGRQVALTLPSICRVLLPCCTPGRGHVVRKEV